MKLNISLVLCVSVFVIYVKSDQKVVRGDAANSTPYTVSLQYNKDYPCKDVTIPSPWYHFGFTPYEKYSIATHHVHVCGGVIITETHILTAAHCVGANHKNVTYRQNELFSIIMGTSYLANAKNSDRYCVKKILLHDSYIDYKNYTSSRYDFAIVFLTRSLDLSNEQKARKIAFSSRFIEKGVKAQLTGWGSTTYFNGSFSDKLRGIYVETSFCGGTQHDADLCTVSSFGTTPCFGDSGGPLTFLNETEVIGIARGSNCIFGGLSIFARISYYYNWIIESIGSD